MLFHLPFILEERCWLIEIDAFSYCFDGRRMNFFGWKTNDKRPITTHPMNQFTLVNSWCTSTHRHQWLRTEKYLKMIEEERNEKTNLVLWPLGVDWAFSRDDPVALITHEVGGTRSPVYVYSDFHSFVLLLLYMTPPFCIWIFLHFLCCFVCS